MSIITSKTGHLQVVEEFGLFKFDKVEAGPTKYALHAYQSWKPGLLEKEYAGHVERVSISLGNTGIPGKATLSVSVKR